jgi:hypothetical protein
MGGVPTGREAFIVTRPILRHLALASAVSTALVVAIAPQVRACKVPEKSASISGATSLCEPDAGAVATCSYGAPTSDPCGESGSRSTLDPLAVELAAPVTHRRIVTHGGAHSAAVTHVASATHPGARAIPAATESKCRAAPYTPSARPTQTAAHPTDAAGRVAVSRPHRMPEPEIF